MKQAPKDLEGKPSPDQPPKTPDSAPAENGDAAMRVLLAELKEDVGALRKQVDTMTGHFSGITGFIQRKDTELKRWQDGYDWVKQKSLLSDFVAFAEHLRKQAPKLPAEARKEWEGLLDVVAVSLENHGVEIITPREGDKFDEWKGCAEAVSAQKTANREDDGVICKVSMSGFWIQAGEKRKIVAQKARVVVWRFASDAEADEAAPAVQQGEKK